MTCTPFSCFVVMAAGAFIALAACLATLAIAMVVAHRDRIARKLEQQRRT
jgi:hypothetical protein